MSELRMDAYYFSFQRTGVLAIDNILSSVATAGKHFHHTESWGDEQDFLGGLSEVDIIQRAADQAAAQLGGHDV